jgi:hypothetical protein
MYSAMLKVENFLRQAGEPQYGDEGVSYGGPVQIGLIENPPCHVSSGRATLKNPGVPGNLNSLNGTNLVSFISWRCKGFRTTSKESKHSWGQGLGGL